MTRGKVLLFVALAVALAAGGFWATEHGLRTCGWLDVMLGRSGCLGTARFDGVVPGRGNPDVPFTEAGQAILAVDALTADGWRNALLVFDPVSGTEQGRYPVPLGNTIMQLLPSHEGPELLLLCGIVEAQCTEAGGNGVMADRTDFSVFTEVADADPSLRTFPGTPVPDPVAYGREARFAADGQRIVTNRRNEGIMLLDADGRLIAELDSQFLVAQSIVISPDASRLLAWRRSYGEGDGDRLRIWDATDGRQLARIDGAPGWQLRGPPFWSSDSRLIFAPRRDGGAMLLDRFAAPTPPAR